MFAIAILIGIYSYLIFSLGLLGFLYKQNLIVVTIAYLFIVTFFAKQNLNLFEFKDKVINYIKKTSKLGLIFLSLIIVQSVVNFIGALGPELGFDALWYHLTLPKIYLTNHFIDYIPGGLLYYSAIPKLTEMIYTAALAMSNEIGAKLIHFSFGILSLIALYNLSRKFLSKTFSFLVLVLFYSNLVVGWMSITAYVDLARTFFEIMAVWGFLEWQKKKELKWLVESAVMLGLAISAKLLAIGSMFIFLILIITYFLHKKNEIKNLFISLFAYWFICLLVPLPWFIFSGIHTGNPVYPFFTNIYPVKFNFNLVNPLNLSDPISPFYVIFLPIAGFFYREFKPALKIISLYSFFAIIVWYLTPQAGGGRFILPYLPVFSIISVVIIRMISKEKIRHVLIGSIIFFAAFSIIYRGGANLKFVPVILGKESKAHFLSKNLNFRYGDFYDTDEYFKKKIKTHDTVLLYGFHNLYYIDFPFIDSSYVKNGDMFNYIAVQGNNFPERFKFWNPIYYNEKTNVKLYSVGGLKWVY